MGDGCGVNFTSSAMIIHKYLKIKTDYLLVKTAPLYTTIFLNSAVMLG